MWGWKTLERRIDSEIDLETVKKRMQAQGFGVFAENEGVLFLKKPERAGTIELAIAAVDGGLYLQMRYGSFVLFDTGDLVRHLEAAMESVSPSAAA